MPNATIGGVQIYYESHGEGFPLILSWGVGGSTRLWRSQVSELSRKHRLILWDPRGHGQSDSPHDPSKYSIPISARDLRGLMDALGIRKAYVGGHSLGAGVATAFTLEHPEHVEGLLLFNSATSSGLPVRPELKATWERHIELALSKGMQPIVDEFASHPDIWVTVKLDPKDVRGLKADYLALDPVGYANSVRTILENPHRAENLPRIKVPTLVLTGEHDPALPLMKVIAENVPGAVFVEMKGTGHLSNLDDPAAFSEHVLSFLDAVGRRRSRA
jgi:2-succinyl-6-hydroxy-2,4-cyclohexadiene-1-carboxylate synthase